MPLSATTKPQDAAADEAVFSALQMSIETRQSELKDLRKRLRPVKKRLVQKMEDEGLEELTCGQFVLSHSSPTSDDDAPSVVFNRERLESFLSEEQMDEYCRENEKPAKKRRIVKCERRIVDVSDDEEKE